MSQRGVRQIWWEKYLWYHQRTRTVPHQEQPLWGLLLPNSYDWVTIKVQEPELPAHDFPKVDSSIVDRWTECPGECCITPCLIFSVHAFMNAIPYMRMIGKKYLNTVSTNSAKSGIGWKIAELMLNTCVSLLNRKEVRGFVFTSQFIDIRAHPPSFFCRIVHYWPRAASSRSADELPLLRLQLSHHFVFIWVQIGLKRTCWWCPLYFRHVPPWTSCPRWSLNRECRFHRRGRWNVAA